MLPIPDSIMEFVSRVSKDYRNVSADIGKIYAAKIANPVLLSGSGVCLKMEEGPLNPKKPVADESVIRFTLSDGTYSVECLAHNGPEKGRLPYYRTGWSGSASDWLGNTLMLLTESVRDGKQIEVSGYYEMFGRDKVFVVKSVRPAEARTESQMTDEQFQEFISLCAAEGEAYRPLELMCRDDTLWSKLYADPAIKYAVMLFCLSPQTKTDMMHIGIVSSMGEGKDHLIETVIEPLVPCGVASTGKLCTIPGLFGAMNGEDLNSIELGLIPKMDNERIAVSEFQTWQQEVFGELMNVMANGSFTMQKGQVDTKRSARTNFLFLGNPPRDWKPKKNPDGTVNADVKDDAQMGMLAAFGEYTYQIMSRLTLIFARMQLTDGDNTYQIEDKIMDSMNGVYKKKEFNSNLEMWRTFFREYLRYVSALDPNYDALRGEIRKSMDKIKQDEAFKMAFLQGGRATRDFRKFQEFVNLCKGYARLNGETEVSITSIYSAEQLFLESMSTLKGDPSWKYLVAGLDNTTATLHGQLKDASDYGIFQDIKELRNAVAISNNQLEEMINKQLIRPQPETEIWTAKNISKCSWIEIHDVDSDVSSEPDEEAQS